MLAGSRSSRASLCRFAGLLLLSFVVACAGGGTYSVNEGQIAGGFLPSIRSVDHHPDSLKALQIAEEDGRIQYDLSRDYEALIQKWSCSFQNVSSGRDLQTPTYATFWSLELSLASLQPEAGILTLRKERAEELLEERREEYFDTIQIDVYWFPRRGGDGIITGPGAQAKLRVGDRTYRPVRESHSPLREAFLAGGETALYRRNTLYFPRTVDGTDILEGVSRLRLDVRQTGASSTYQFTWRWRTNRAAR